MEFDALMLSRIQFAAATAFHFLFVPLTIGLSLMIAVMETKWAWTGDETYKRMARFWGKLFIINFVIGVVTGITLEFQFGTNWSRYSTYVGDIFGSLLAIEATAAFFLESTFIGVWLFGWDRLKPATHCAVMWCVAIGSNFSALWILLANGFMQNPVGYEVVNGNMVLTDFWAVLFNPVGWGIFWHTMFACYVIGAFFVMAISGWHLMRKQHVEIFVPSFRMALIVGLLATVAVAGQGHHHGNQVAKYQPAKLAAMEGHWETQAAAPMYLLSWPDVENERDYFEGIRIPALLSILAYNDPNAVVKGLKDFPKEDRPPVTLTFFAFRAMVGIGTLMLGLMAWAVYRRNKLTESPMLMRTMLLALPLPYLAAQFGWIVTEVGRQPWVVYGMLRTADAHSTVVSAGQVWFSLGTMTVMYTFIGLVGFYLIAKYARKGPITK